MKIGNGYLKFSSTSWLCRNQVRTGESIQKHANIWLNYFHLRIFLTFYSFNGVLSKQCNSLGKNAKQQSSHLPSYFCFFLNSKPSFHLWLRVSIKFPSNVFPACSCNFPISLYSLVSRQFVGDLRLNYCTALFWASYCSNHQIIPDYLEFKNSLSLRRRHDLVLYEAAQKKHEWNWQA